MIETAHYIRRDILRQLSRTVTLPFSRLKPATVQNGHFTYHLQALISQGLVVREASGYRLSPSGMRHVGGLSRTKLTARQSPAMFVLLIISDGDGAYVLNRRPSQPFLGRYTLPGGMVLFDDDADHVAESQLQEKTGLDAPLTYKGFADLHLNHSGSLVSHTLAYLYGASVTGQPVVKSRNPNFTSNWIMPDTLPKAELMPDVPGLIKYAEADAGRDYLRLHLDETAAAQPL